MRKICSLFLLITHLGNTQQKNITLEEIWSPEYKYNKINSLQPIGDSNYCTLKFDSITNSTSVEKFSYQTLEKTATIISSNDIEELPPFESYCLNFNQTKVLLGVDHETIFRHSTNATYFIYDIESEKLQLLDQDRIQEPTFSPDGNKVAYVKENNIYIKNLETLKTTKVTSDGEENKIINGIADWVYEEEFSFVRAFQWSKDSKFIVFTRFDQSLVRDCSMDIYGEKLYPTQYVFKYPKAGENNSKVTLHLYTISSGVTSNISLSDYEYIPRIKWSEKDNIFAVITLNRNQDDLKLYEVNTNTMEAKIILNEREKKFIEINDLHFEFLKDNRFLWTSDRSGYNHIYLYSDNGKKSKQITKGHWDVSKVYGYDSKSKRIFYQSVEEGPIERIVYSIKINGKGKEKLSHQLGTNDAMFSNDFNYFINSHSSSKKPPVYTLNHRNGTQIKEVLNNDSLEKKLNKYNIATKEFLTLDLPDAKVNAFIIKPNDFDPNKKYPLLMYQYSGPGSQSVANQWNRSDDYWYYMLANQGYLVACVDGRGTGFKGRDFKKVTYKELGKYEVLDQINAAKIFAKMPYIDQNRIGIWGWSYGGFISSNCLLKGNDIFKMAIAVAPVTSWRFYNSIYTERYMQSPQENPDGYDNNSPINFVDKLKGKYLLIHGSADDNVHLQNTMRMINAMIRADVSYDSEIYPDRAHSIYKGENTRLHLYRKMTSFIFDNL